MNKGRLLISTLILFCSVFSISAYAQFEGQISINIYDEEDGQTDVSKLNLYATSDRILIKGEDNFDIMEISSNGMLIRNDKKDFVIMTGENQAMQVTKIEIEGLIEMMRSMEGSTSTNANQSNESKMDYSFSEKSQEILGLETAELIIKDSKNPNKHLSIWLTPDIDINWGMLGERWNNLPPNVDNEFNGMSQEIIFKGKNFPLMIEAVHGEKRTTLMEVSNINQSSVARAMVEIPSGVMLVSFKDYIFQKMME